jgi:hypothetical protein
MFKKIFLITVLIFISYILILFVASRFQIPSNEREWESGFEKLVTVNIYGDMVTLNNVRDWRYDQNGPISYSYKTQTVNSSEIVNVWYLISKPNQNGPMGHVFYIFDFADGQTVSLSIEARREKNEPFSGIRGVFNAYEIMYMWGSEEDFLVFRPVTYDKQVYMYPIKGTSGEAKALFMSLVNETKRLETEPTFYNSLAHNCTNTFYQHANSLNPGTVPFRLTQWLVGWSDRTILRLGYFNTDITHVRTLRPAYYVSDLVKEYYQDVDMSQLIRQNLPNQ